MHEVSLWWLAPALKGRKDLVFHIKYLKLESVGEIS